MFTIGKYIAVTALILLAACDASTSEKTNKYVLPEELKDCRVYRMQGSGAEGALTIVRCPNSEVTTQSGGKSKINVNIK